MVFRPERRSSIAYHDRLQLPVDPKEEQVKKPGDRREVCRHIYIAESNITSPVW